LELFLVQPEVMAQFMEDGKTNLFPDFGFV